ncbi:MAG: hypothetical protein AB7P69_02010 [Candidatus Binatia bacterium]
MRSNYVAGSVAGIFPGQIGGETRHFPEKEPECSLDEAKRNPGTNEKRSRNPGFHFVPSGLQTFHSQERAVANEHSGEGRNPGREKGIPGRGLARSDEKGKSLRIPALCT